MKNQYKLILTLAALISIKLFADNIAFTDGLNPQTSDRDYNLWARTAASVARGITVGVSEFTRTNDTAAYVSGDVISTNTGANYPCMPMTFTNVLPVTGGGIVMKVRLTVSDTNAVFPSELWLFSSTNIYLQNDNAPLSLWWTNNAQRLGYISIPALTKPTGATDLSFALNADARLSVNAGLGNTNLYGYLVVKSGYTPSTGGAQKFEVKLLVLGQ